MVINLAGLAEPSGCLPGPQPVARAGTPVQSIPRYMVHRAHLSTQPCSSAANSFPALRQLVPACLTLPASQLLQQLLLSSKLTSAAALPHLRRTPGVSETVPCAAHDPAVESRSHTGHVMVSSLQLQEDPARSRKSCHLASGIGPVRTSRAVPATRSAGIGVQPLLRRATSRNACRRATISALKSKSAATAAA